MTRMQRMTLVALMAAIIEGRFHKDHLPAAHNLYQELPGLALLAMIEQASPNLERINLLALTEGGVAALKFALDAAKNIEAPHA